MGSPTILIWEVSIILSRTFARLLNALQCSLKLLPHRIVYLQTRRIFTCNHYVRTLVWQTAFLLPLCHAEAEGLQPTQLLRLHFLLSLGMQAGWIVGGIASDAGNSDEVFAAESWREVLAVVDCVYSKIVSELFLLTRAVSI